MNGQSSEKYGKRLKEITSVLHKHEISRGVTLEELGPTYIKLGQIASMHSDILPKKYCDELMRLRSEVAPMPFEKVQEVLEEAYGCPYTEVFEQIEPIPQGSASIAQVHRAVLKTGEKVVVKVQRKGIYDIMSQSSTAPASDQHERTCGSGYGAGRAVDCHPGGDEFPNRSCQYGGVFQKK